MSTCEEPDLSGLSDALIAEHIDAGRVEYRVGLSASTAGAKTIAAAVKQMRRLGAEWDYHTQNIAQNIARNTEASDETLEELARDPRLDPGVRAEILNRLIGAIRLGP